MGKSLYNFSKTNDGVRESKDKVDTKINQKDVKANIDEADVKKKINQYSKLNQGDLMKELSKEVGKQKAEGNFDINKLSSQFDNIKHMLDEKQRDNLERLLKNLK